MPSRPVRARVAAIELGTHCPVAVRIGENGESEGELAAGIVDAFRENDLVIGDRYYGNGKWAVRFLTAPYSPSQIIQRLSDNSCLVKVKNPDTGEDIILRQIKAKVRRHGGKWVKIRLWTNSLDHQIYPANELIPLYAMRWEQEIAFREIKKYLHGENLLLSHTTITAVQEICALFMAQAVIATVRTEVACTYNIPVMQVSFSRILDTCRNVCWLYSIANNILSPEQISKISELAQQKLVSQISKPGRNRGCPRHVRQPVNKWPRLMKNRYDKGEFEYGVRIS